MAAKETNARRDKEAFGDLYNFLMLVFPLLSQSETELSGRKCRWLFDDWPSSLESQQEDISSDASKNASASQFLQSALLWDAPDQDQDQ